MDVIIPAKIATCRENKSPTAKVTPKVTASDPVALDTVLICLNLIREAPINTTSVANEQSGTNAIKFPSNIEPRMIKPPATRLATLVRAPD